MYWEKDKECLEREELEQVQLERLQSMVYRIYKNVPFYRRKFDKLGLSPDCIESLGDLKKLPFTSREDLIENYPYGFFAVPLREIVRLHSSAGKTGKPIVIGYTKNDLKTQAHLSARVFSACGVQKDDIVQISYNFGLNPQAFALQAGAELMGATVIPISSVESLSKQLQIILDYRTSVLASSPTFALRLAEQVENMDLNPNALILRIGLFGGEPWPEHLRREIEERLKIEAFDHYGLTEMMGPVVACECQYKTGLHVNEDHFLVEIIDPQTLEPLPMGETGELVITTLTKEAMPLVRYRTRDLTKLYLQECPCGRTLIKIDRIKGRTDHVIFAQGIKFFPSDVESILCELFDKLPEYQILIEGPISREKVSVILALPEKFFFDEMKEQSKLVEQIKNKLFTELSLPIEVKLVDKRCFLEGNKERVVDKRQPAN